MSTYGIMQTRISDELNRTDLSSPIQKAIKSAIKYYETKRFWFNEAKATLNTVASTEFYGLPTDYLDIDTLGITINSQYYQLKPVTHEWLDNINWGAGTLTGYPYRYAVYENDIRLYPIPNNAYTLKLTYLKQFDELSATGDANAWMTTGEEMIRLHAKVDLLENIIRGQEAFGEAGVLKNREYEIVRQLTSNSTKRRATGRIRSS